MKRFLLIVMVMSLILGCMGGGIYGIEEESNLALGKDVYTSSTQSNAQRAVDGDYINTWWVASAADALTAPMWLYVDLGNKAEITRTVVMHHSNNDRTNYENWFYSNDAITWHSAAYTAVFNDNFAVNSNDKVVRRWEYTFTEPITARYVKVQSTKNYQISVEEIEIYGIMAEPEEEGDNSQYIKEFSITDGELSTEFDEEIFDYWCYIGDVIPTVEVTVKDDYYAEVVQATANTMQATVSLYDRETDEKAVTYTVLFLKNLALYKEGTASSGYNQQIITEATDGNFGTKWNANSGGAIPEWILVDLEGISEVYEVRVYEYYSNVDQHFERLEYSIDGTNWTKVDYTMTKTNTEYTYNNKVIRCRVYSFEKFDAQYVKVGAYEASGNTTIVEFEVYGVQSPVVSSNANLKNLSLSAGSYSPEFSPYITDYIVNLSRETAIPTVSAEARSLEATIQITQAAEGNPKAKVVVTAGDQTTQKTYTITFAREKLPEENAGLSSIKLSSGILNPNFHTAITDYEAVIEKEGSLPQISATPMVSGATVDILQPTASNMQGVIKVTARNGVNSDTYTINFVRKSAKLSGLTVKDKDIDFNPDTYTYHVFLKQGEDIPQVTAKRQDETSKISYTQAGPESMTAYVAVTTSGGEFKNTYKIIFSYEQSIQEAYILATQAVKNLGVSNSTVEGDIMGAIQKVITNSSIRPSWTTAFSKTAATSSGVGLITGVVTLEMEGDTVNISIHKAIAKLESSSQTGGSKNGGVYNASFVGAVGGEENDLPEQDKKPGMSIKDEIKGHWAEKEIGVLIDTGVVQGDEDGLGLDKVVTRAEFITMMIRRLELEVSKYQHQMEDIREGDWFADYMQTAVNHGLISGFDGFMRPNDNITREEAAKILVSAYENLFGVIDSQPAREFTDSQNTSDWAKEYIAKGVNAGLIQGFETGEFLPKQVLLREQAMVLSYRAKR